MVSKKYGGITVNFHCEKEKLKATNLIYLLKFTNGKYYVGQTNTKFGLISRIQNHCYESYRQNKKRNAYKDNIINKYKTFDVFILKECTLQNIDEFEIFYINILKRKLVNIENGGCLNKTKTVETLKKISEKVRKYNKLNPKQIKINVYDLEGNYVRSHKTINEIKEFYNVTSTVVSNALYKENRKFIGKYQIFREGTEKIINYNKKERKTYKRKANNPNELVYKYDSKTGKFIESFAIGKINSNERYYIKLAIKRNSLYKGFAWSFEKINSIIPPKSHYEKISEKLSRPVLQLNDELCIVKKWNSLKEAGEAYGDKKGELIRQVCIRWRRHTKGFVWCYEDEYEWYKRMWNEKLVRKR
jgi:hypothetical protein